jgi:hypothetical protein
LLHRSQIFWMGWLSPLLTERKMVEIESEKDR